MRILRSGLGASGAGMGLLLGATSCSLLLETGGLAGGTGSPPPDDVPPGSGPVDASNASDAGEAGVLDEYGSLVLSDGPSLYYRFDETSGDVRDETGNHPGTLVGGPQRGIEGAFRGSKAIRLDGSDDGVDVGDVFAFGGHSPYTVEAWFRPDAYDDEFRFIVARDNESQTSRQHYGVYIRENGWSFERYVDNQSRSAFFQPPPAVGAWYHVVATYDGASLRVFVDGEVRVERPDGRASKPRPTTFFVGRGPWPESSLRGALDELAVYEKALSPDRIKAHYEAGLRAR